MKVDVLNDGTLVVEESGRKIACIPVGEDEIRHVIDELQAGIDGLCRFLPDEDRITDRVALGLHP